MRQYLSDQHLKYLSIQQTKAQEMLFGPERVYDEGLQDYVIKARPLVENAAAIVNGIQKQINEYTKATYPDLFP